MKEIIVDKGLIASCGLYCGACKQYLSNKCQGCHKNQKASWCKVRVCCSTNSYSSCADCKKISNVNKCKKHNNVISKVFAFIFGSDRKACIDAIKKSGYESYAKDMSSKKIVSIKK